MQTSTQTATGADNPAVSADDFCVSQLSAAGNEPQQVVAVFARNAATTIRATLESVLQACTIENVSVYVLAYGCTDDTAAQVRSCAALLPELSLVEIAMDDRANAWNIFVHDLLGEDEAGRFTDWTFIDGDITLTPDAITLLASSLAREQNALAAGGLPGSGRDMEVLRQGMVHNRLLAGNFYLLRGRLVQQFRLQSVRMPRGLIGEDFILSWIIENLSWGDETPQAGDCFLFASGAEFMFRSLSPLRLGDYRKYLRRQWQHALRGIQCWMLINLIGVEGLAAVPATVEELYQRGPVPQRVSLTNPLQAVLHLLAVRRIRTSR